MDFLKILPPELCVNVLEQLDVTSLNNLCLTCKQWKYFIEHTDVLWKNICFKNCPAKDVLRDRVYGFTWREALKRNYGALAVRDKWLSGAFSQPNSSSDLPEKHMWPMDVDTWGDILTMELTR